MTLRAVSAGLCGAIALAACCTACADPADDLRPAAVKAARDIAAKALARLRAATPPMPASINQAIAEIVPEANYVGGTVLLGKNVPAAGRFTAGFAFVTLVGNGVSGQYEQIAVRLCVSYSGDLDHPGAVDMTDLPCPPGLPGPDNGVPVDREVKLAG